MLRTITTVTTNMENKTDTHAIFTKEPADWMQYVYKQVAVLSEDGVEHTGWVFTIDPVTQSVVLVEFNVDSKLTLDIIHGAAVNKITIINANTELYKSQLDQLFKPAVDVLTSDELQCRQDRLKGWLNKNLIPVTVNGDILTVADVLFIAPPYSHEDCRSTNEIVLDRVQGLIKNIPLDGAT